MDRTVTVQHLKQCLRAEVARFYKRDQRVWKEPIVQTLRQLRDVEIPAVFFGGTLRSLIIARLFQSKPGRPRDVDIVVAGASIADLKKQFQELIIRETRFGGLKLKRLDWQFDLWPLQSTWAFVHDKSGDPRFSELPATTFFNLEAIAVEVWPEPGKPRQVYSGDDQFFEGLLTKTLDINREENPFPELCVVRALIFASALQFQISPRLARYIAARGRTLETDQLEDVQRQHYGVVRQFGNTMRDWINLIGEQVTKDPTHSIHIPFVRQLTFWPKHADYAQVKVHVVASKKNAPSYRSIRARSSASK